MRPHLPLHLPLVTAALLALLAACQRSPTPDLGPSAAATVTVRARVAGGADDAEENAAGRVVTTSSDLELTADGAAQTLGLRFPGLMVPPGATVVSAAVQFKTDEATAQGTALTIRAQNSAHAAGFAASAKDVSSRPHTAAFVRWSPAAWPEVGEAGTLQRTPNLAPLVQAVVGRPDWRSGNALALVVTGTGKRVAESFDGDRLGAPVLSVVYTPPPAPNRPPVVAAGPDQTVSLAAAQLGVPLSAGVTDDGLPGGALRSSWSLVSGPGSAAFADRAARETTVRLSGPGVYTLRAEASDGLLTAFDELNVTVAAPQPTPDPVAPTMTVVAAGDVACAPSSAFFNGGQGTADACRQADTANLVGQLGADAVLVPGDVQYENGLYTDFMASYDLSWGRYKSITHPVPGNHEYHLPGAEGYFRYFGARAGDPAKGYYSFDLGGWHVVALNSNCAAVGGCGAGSAQERWLRDDLAAHPNRCTLAFWHHPLFSSGKHGSNPATAALWAALTDAGAELVVVGHDHHYERFAPQTAAGVADSRGLRQFLVGTGGKSHYAVAGAEANSEVRDGNTHGVLELKLAATGYTWRFVPAAGGTFTDAGSAACL